MEVKVNKSIIHNIVLWKTISLSEENLQPIF